MQAGGSGGGPVVLNTTCASKQVFEGASVTCVSKGRERRAKGRPGTVASRTSKLSEFFTHGTRRGLAQTFASAGICSSMGVGYLYR
jgi:hypothetical protein